MKIFILVVFFSLGVSAVGQQLIRFSGVVVEDQQYKPVAGTTILNQTSRGGAVSDSLGFFTIEAKPGDTLVFNDVRYLNSVFVIPEVLDKSDYGIVQLMISDKKLLEEVQIFSFPTEEEFKRAFVDTNPDTLTAPDLHSRAVEARKNLMQTIREAYEDEQEYYRMWADRRIYELTGQAPANNFLNPIRWTEFINRHIADDEEN